MNKGQNKHLGFSLVEVIVSIVILAIVFTILLNVFSNQKMDAARVELTTKAVFLGQELVNRIIAKEFDENSELPWTSTLSLGPEMEDQYYDDVDDFAGYSNSSISGFPGFTETARVFYVSPTGSFDDSVFTATDMKRVIVTVTHNEIEPVVLNTLISSHY